MLWYQNNLRKQHQFPMLNLKLYNWKKPHALTCILAKRKWMMKRTIGCHPCPRPRTGYRWPPPSRRGCTAPTSCQSRRCPRRLPTGEWSQPSSSIWHSSPWWKSSSAPWLQKRQRFQDGRWQFGIREPARKKKCENILNLQELKKLSDHYVLTIFFKFSVDTQIKIASKNSVKLMLT